MINRKSAITSLCLIAFANPLPAMASCVGPREAAALKVASLKQQLMVAGLACRASDSYNKFVLGHQSELQHSDEDLKDFFIRNGVEADYDAYKTKLANLDAYREAYDHDSYCAATAGDFSSLATSGDLMAAAEGEQLIVGETCEAPILAMARPAAAPPVRVAVADPVVVGPNRQPPAKPYTDIPPPAPSLQTVSADRNDNARSVPSVAAPDSYGDANVPPRPSALYQHNDDRYWYYRWLYAQPGAFAGYYGR
jgi:hypothetical protein